MVPFSIATTPCSGLLCSSDCSTLPLIRTLKCRVLNKVISRTILLYLWYDSTWESTRPWRTRYSLGQCADIRTCYFIQNSYAIVFRFFFFFFFFFFLIWFFSSLIYTCVCMQILIFIYLNQKVHFTCIYIYESMLVLV